ARFGDALENLTIPGAMADPHELPVEYRCVEVMAEMLRNTTKPFTFWFHDRASAKYLVEMVIALRGDEAKAAQYPISYPFLEPISPLRFPRDGIDLLYETARINMPVPVGPMAQMGLSAPATIAGTMAAENAEVLAGICITQLIKPGLPVCYGGICHAFDMRTTQMIFAGPEQALFGVGMTELGKSYGLPVYINVGLTDSKLPDGQAGLEAMGTLLPGAGAGADIFGHMGICGVDQATSLDILLLQHEVIRYVESVLREIPTDDDAIPIDLIDEAGPGGTFIDKMHTAEHFRESLFMPDLLDRNYFAPWLDGGASDMAQRIKTRKDELLATHQAEPMDADLEKEVNRIVQAAKQQLG
ncbi:trimethylamine methyltransferase family protein, partial [Planctomycetota bacterium]